VGRENLEHYSKIFLDYSQRLKEHQQSNLALILEKVSLEIINSFSIDSSVGRIVQAIPEVLHA